MRNRLASETSPYLLQHADNPVHWYPWGDEAFDAARKSERPVLLSIGYSACHWCHVMAHESFEDERIAGLMNGLFINVKVDREERPDVDAVYMDAVQAMTGRGGWPLTVFLTPDGEPFYGGTYFPPSPRQGMPGFPQLLEGIAEAWSERRDEVTSTATRLTDAIREAATPSDEGRVPEPELLARAVAAAEDAWDENHGGFGGAPKFPNAPLLRFLLDRSVRTGRPVGQRIVIDSLEQMARGGIHDHLCGGFHRYAVDADWTVPHFEKMLYDNALLTRLYLDAWRLTGDAAHLRVLEGTVGWVLDEMRSDDGGFFAAQDADTADGEGVYYTWTPAEIDAALPKERAEAFKAWYGVTAGGNFEGGRSVLTRRRSPGDVAADLDITPDALRERVAAARETLAEIRQQRERPAVDRKVLSDWNGLMIDALARAGAAVERDDWVRAAARAARFVLGEGTMPDGGLAHSWADGRPGAPAFLEDYAAMVGACLSLYESTFDPSWADEAEALLDEMHEQFAAPDGGYYRTGPRHDALVTRQKEVMDTATPSGNALAAAATARLAALLGRSDLADRIAGILGVAAERMERSPLAFSALLGALEGHHAGSVEIAVVGTEASSAPMIRTIRGRVLPGSIVAWAPGPGGDHERVPLLEGRTGGDGGAAVYLCQDHVCGPPIRSADELSARLDRLYGEDPTG